MAAHTHAHMFTSGRENAKQSAHISWRSTCCDFLCIFSRQTQDMESEERRENQAA